MNIGCVQALVLCAIAASLPACNRSKAPAQGDDAGGESEQALAEKYGAMSPTERVQAALNACYVGPNCRSAAVVALFNAAENDAERDALRATARPAFARQYEAALVAEGRKPESVTTTEEGRTLSVKGEICSRFLLDNFAGGKNGKMARVVGFWRFECKNRALNAAVDLAG